MPTDDSLASLVDRYLLATADVHHLEEERERLRDAILAAAGPEAREIAGTGGAVRVGVQRSCRFDAQKAVAALDAAGALAPLASLHAQRLRRAFDEDPAVRRALADLIERVDTRTVTAVPPRLRWTPASRFVERLREKATAHD